MSKELNLHGSNPSTLFTGILPPALFYPIAAVKRAFGCKRDGWTVLTQRGLKPFRIGNKYFVESDNLAAVCKLLVSGGDSSNPEDDQPEHNVRTRPRRTPAKQPPGEQPASTTPDHLALSRQKYLTIKDAAAFLRVSEKTIRRKIEKGDLVGHDGGQGKILLDREQVEATIRSGRLKKGRN